ncbi:DNA-directed RNA polymerase III subunit RPC9 [Smittium culicis]|uniref:DNA-directed RNA polymerase III subunit RPC9 n=1 Tax=Smittium culicis TaxID=133412 RepID=A0A1R1YKZ8_9FUNG|nr:DNA-directed RNA polymerase III subunit RPC9 [Smittium culicis]
MRISNYFNSTPIKYQTPEQINETLKSLSKFSLTKAEKLQILNIRPNKEVDLYLIIEEPEERFSKDQIAEILTIVNSILIAPETEPEEIEENYDDEYMD